MPINNLLEYTGNHSITSVTLCNYHRDEVNDDDNDDTADKYKINNIMTTKSRSFE